MKTPKPSAPHRKLDKLAGKWTGEEIVHIPLRGNKAESKAKATWDFRRDVDGFFLLADYDERIAGKPGVRGHGVIGWDPKDKSYTLHWFDNFGNPPATPGRGQWTGNTLAFVHDYGQGPRGRTIFALDGRKAMDFLIEMSEDGKTWNRAIEGKYRRR